MKPRSIITVILVAFVAVSLGYLVAGELRGPGPSPVLDSPIDTDPSGAAPETAVDSLDRTPTADHTVVAYYFHGNFRCATCRRIEALTHEALVDGFSDVLASGRLEWRVVNVEKPENRHFVDDFQLSTRSVVFADIAGGTTRRWKSLPKVWQLVHNPTDFTEYIQEEASDFMGGTS